MLSNFLLLSILLLISIKDFKEGIIPDFLLIGLALLGLFRFESAQIVSSLLLGFLSYSLYKIYPIIRKKQGLGLGDVKMMAISGLWLDPVQIPFYLFIAGVAGAGIAFLWRTLKKGERFPFGPALALSLGICILGPQGSSIGENKTMAPFHGPSLAPASGNKPDSLVVFIHGYGASGEDLLELGKVWSSLLPTTLFVAPHGPSASELHPSGRQWFSLRDWDPDHPLTKSQINQILIELQSVTPAFNQYLDHLLETYHIPPEKLALVGFSQGSMFALHIALNRSLCAGVVAYSGAFIEDPATVNVTPSPILLIHGLADTVVLPSYSQIAEARLKALGVPVNLTFLSGLGHGIDERGLLLGGEFLKEHLCKNQQSDLWERTKESNN